MLIVGDIDRGGVFASLLGTWEWLTHDERALVRGFILNKFRGDPSLLAPAPALLDERTGIPVLGVVPYVEDLAIPDEDAANLTHSPHSNVDAPLEIAIVRLPHVANLDEFGVRQMRGYMSVMYPLRGNCAHRIWSFCPVRRRRSLT